MPLRQITVTGRIREGDPTGTWVPNNMGESEEQRYITLTLDHVPYHDLARLASAGIRGESVSIMITFLQLELPEDDLSISESVTPDIWTQGEQYDVFRIGETVRTLTGQTGVIQGIDRPNQKLLVRFGQGIGDLIPMDPFDLDHIEATTNLTP